MGCRLWGRTEADTPEATQQQQQQLKRAESGARREIRGGRGVFPVERKASSKNQRLMSEDDDSSGLTLNSSVVWLDLDVQESQSNRDAGARW